MLRITVEEKHGWATIRVEGALDGLWVKELEQCWEATLVSPDRVLVDLSDVRSMDAAGVDLLHSMHEAGTQLRAKGLLTNYIVEQIQQNGPEIVSGEIR